MVHARRSRPVERKQTIAGEAGQRREAEGHGQADDAGQRRTEERSAEARDVGDALVDGYERRAVDDRYPAHEFVEQDQLEARLEQ